MTYRSFVSRKAEREAARLTLESLGDIVTAAELAKATHLSLRTIRRAIRRGELPAFLPTARPITALGRGMGYRIYKKDAEAWFFGALRGEA